MALVSVFYCEFDIHQGPVLVHEYPPENSQADLFKGLSNYIIPNHSLCNKLNKLRVDENHLLMSLPIDIQDTMKYKRGSFEFNFCFLTTESDEVLSRALYKM